MRPISFNRTVVFKEVIQGIEDVYIEDHLDYTMKNNDFACSGTINLQFIADTGVEKIKTNETVKVDCVLNLSKIDCQKDLRLQFKDYQVQLDERIIRFILRYELLGNGEKVLAFQEVAGEEVEEKVLQALNREYRGDDNFETAEMIKNLLTSNDVDIIGAEDLLPVLAKNTDDINFEEVEIQEMAPEAVLILPTEEKVELESAPVAEAKKIGLKENYSIAFFFYKIVSDEETYEDLGRKFNVEPGAVRSANRDEPLYKGKLVKLMK